VRRFRNAAGFAVLAALPSSLWALRNIQYKSEFGRPVAMHPFLGDAELRSLIHTASAWIFQWRIPDSAWMFVPAALIALFIAVNAWREIRTAESGVGRRLQILFVYAAVYGIMILASAAFIQADLFRDSVRLLIPLHIILLMVLLLCAAPGLKWVRGVTPRRGTAFGVARRAAGVSLIGVFCLFVGSTCLKYIDLIKQDGQGYAAAAYRLSPLMKKISAIPSGITVYSNLDLPVTLYAGRMLVAIPEKIDNSTQRVNPRYTESMQSMASDIRDSSALLVVFHHTDNWLVYPSIEEIGRFVPLHTVDAEPDGAIYEALPDSTEDE
jgi:hypothetical protein